MRVNKRLFKFKKIKILEAQIQVETQIVSQLQGEGKRFSKKRKRIIT